MEFDDLDIDALRRRQGAKWSLCPDNVIPAWVADMDFPVAAPIREALARAVGESDLGYSVYPTQHPLPGVFCERVAERFDWQITPDRVAVITDVVQGLYLGAQLFAESGQGVVIQTPIYPRFLDAVANTGRRFVFNPLVRPRDGYELDLDVLRAAIDPETRVLLLCHPHNPTGRAFTRGELTSLAEVALANDLTVISDEIHADLVFDERRHIPFASLSPEIEARTVTLMSASKAFNIAGLHCALAVFGSATLRKRFESVPLPLRGAVSSLGLAASLAAFRDGQPWLDAVVSYLQANRDVLTAFLAERMPAIGYAAPEATYLAWLDCRALELDESPHRFFRQQARVVLSPGPEFGEVGEGFVRLNFATSRAILREILERMARVV